METIILTVKEYADLRNRSIRTIYRWIEDEVVTATKAKPSNEWEIEIPIAEYDRYAKRRQNMTRKSE